MESSCSLWSKPDILAVLDQICINHYKKLLKRINCDTEHEIKPKYEKLLSFMLTTLKKHGTATQPYSKLDHEEAETLYPGIISLIERCSASYYDVITGTKSALEILFPRGDVTYSDKLAGNNSATFSNYIELPKEVANFIKNTFNTAATIAEVGAGNGGLTWPLLRELDSEPTRYLFTDISRSYIAGAQKTAETHNYNFIDYATINIDQPINSNYKNKFDLVLAYNVVHATPNVTTTLTNLGSFLNKNGYIVLIELFQPFLWQHFIWGSLDTWWSFADDLRTEIPTLSYEQWVKAINTSGFEVVKSIPKQQQEQKCCDTALFIIKKR